MLPIEAVNPKYVDNEILKLTKNGTWVADGGEITHEPTRRLFARSLEKREDGYYLVIGRETKKVEVEDTAYFVTRIDGSCDQGFELWISDGTKEQLQTETLRYRPNRLVCKIRNGKEEAKFLHAPYNELLRDLKRDGKGYFLNGSGYR